MNLVKSYFFVFIISFTTFSLRAVDETHPTECDSFEKLLLDTMMDDFSIKKQSDPFKNGTGYVPMETTTDIEEQNISKKRKNSSPDESPRKIRVVVPTQKGNPSLLPVPQTYLREIEDLRRKLKAERALSEDRKEALSIAIKDQQRKLEYEKALSEDKSEALKIVRAESKQKAQECKEFENKLLAEKLRCSNLENKCKNLELTVKRLQNENEGLLELNAKGIQLEEGEIAEKGE